MKLLLDTHALLWALTTPDHLTERQREAIQDPTNTVFASAINIVEIAIKSSLGKLRVAASLERNRYAEFVTAISDSGFEMLSFTGTHAANIRSLPFHHRDPFDRMIIAQAVAEGYTIVTADAQFSAYPVELL
ncbi:MAG: type II toxin-antitoxin system VapC family toxin [Spirochaetaceae bacterium]|nr:MAG: type II toxin-antitoxin system VapC family toxin [Spirochaetaceae bacterium]